MLIDVLASLAHSNHVFGKQYLQTPNPLTEQNIDEFVGLLMQLLSYSETLDRLGYR